MAIFQNNKRLLQFDLLKVFACLLVIWGHTIMHMYVSDYISNPIYRFIYSFHMYLFMMISGMFASSAMKLDVKVFFIKKAIQLIYPCIVWGVCVLLIIDGSKVLGMGFSNISLSGILSDLYWYSDFWFLKSCFICYCLAYLGTKTKQKKWIWITITLLLSQLIPFFQVPFMYPSFLMGMLLKDSKTLMNFFLKYKYVLCVSFIVMTLFWTKDAWIGSHGVSLLKGTEVQIVVFFLLRLFRLIIGLLGALSFLILFCAIDESKITSGLVRKLCDYGRYSLEIYIVHSVIFVDFVCRYIKFSDLNFFQFNMLVAPIISLFVLFVCFIFIEIVYKSDILSKILFGRYL
ncbi:MAG: acyltransferase family protein [Prevotella sp.]|nr:acyltransferase family protein [Prevotella sp.]